MCYHLFYFRLFQYSWQDSNCGSLELETTALPTDPQPLPWNILFIGTRWASFILAVKGTLTHQCLNALEYFESFNHGSTRPFFCLQDVPGHEDGFVSGAGPVFQPEHDVGKEAVGVAKFLQASAQNLKLDPNGPVHWDQYGKTFSQKVTEGH